MVTQMVTQIEINPNLRVQGDLTVADLHEDVTGPTPQTGDLVEVYERVSGLAGRGQVVEVDESDGSVTVWVDWAGLRVPRTRAALGVRAVEVVQDVEWSPASFPTAV